MNTSARDWLMQSVGALVAFAVAAHADGHPWVALAFLCAGLAARLTAEQARA